MEPQIEQKNSAGFSQRRTFETNLSEWRAAAWLMLLVLLLLEMGCASAPPAPSASTSVPPLLESAIQPPRPPFCVPSCSSKLMEDYGNSLQPPMPATTLEKPARLNINP